MSAEKFLAKFFEKLKASDFAKDKFLEAFYKFYLKEKNSNLFDCYTEYLIRNKQFANDNEREIEINSLFNELKHAILYGVKRKKTALGFVEEKDKNKNVKLEESDTDDDSDDSGNKNLKTTAESKTLRNIASIKPNMSKSPAIKSTSAKSSKLPTKPKTARISSTKTGPNKVQLNKENALKMLSMFIKQSFIVTYEEPDMDMTQEDQEFRENTTDNILDEIVHGKVTYDHEGRKITEDARDLPEAKKDVVFGQRSDMMNIWRDTESKCQGLVKNEKLAALVYKIYFINTINVNNARNDDIEYNRDGSLRKDATASVDGSVPGSIKISSKPRSIETVFLEEIKDLLPIEKFVSRYSNNNYNTVITFVNDQPINQTLTRSKQKLKPIYICAGSQMVLGGNADQGIDTTESMLWMTTTYSSALEKVLHAYPLYANQLILCPNVLVFKDTNYNNLPVPEWQKIAVMNAPCRFRPPTNIQDLKENEVDARLYDKKTTFAKKTDVIKFKDSLANAIETALFFGYDTIVLDDRAIADNQLPAHQTAKSIKEVIDSFKGRVKEFVISIPKSRSFNVFRYYFT
jgi:hypothetical protein